MSDDTRPPGWSYNPSQPSKRSILVFFALLGFAISVYLSLYQLGVFANIWDPFFGDESSKVLHSELSRMLPVPDAALGAAAYLIEAILGAAGSRQRWRSEPWIVILYGLTVVGLGIVSIFLVIYQSAFLHAWCTLCLASAAISIGLIIPVFDEPLATIEHLKRETQNGNSLGRALRGSPASDRRPRDIRQHAKKFG